MRPEKITRGLAGHHAYDDRVAAHLRLPDDSAARAVEEIHQHLQLGTGLYLRGDFPARLLEDEPRAVQGLVGLLDRSDFFGAEAAPLQPLAVDPERLRGVPRRHDIRRQVLQQHRRDPGDRMRADRDELMRPGESAENGVIPDANMAGKRRDVGEDRMVADLAVMGDVDVSHDPVVASDPCDARVLRGAAIEAAVLADRVALADLERGRLAAVLFVLGRAAERAEPEDAVLRPDAGSPLDHDVRPDRGPLPDLDVLADDRIRAHGHPRRELRSGVDHRARVDHIERSVHRIFASAASASPTRACTANFHRPRVSRSSATSRSSWSPGTTGRLKRASSIPTR